MTISALTFRNVSGPIALFFLLGLWAWLLVAHITVRTDLDFFMPRAATPAVQLLGAKLREGPTSSQILMALSGNSPERMAQASSRLADTLESSGHFRFVANGRLRVTPKLKELIFGHRYLLDPGVERSDFSAVSLRKDLRNALRLLATTSGMAIAETFPADPTNRLLKIADHWKRGATSKRLSGVWFSDDGKLALLMAQTIASGLDFEAQRLAQDVIAKAVSQVEKEFGVRAELTGLSIFANKARQRIRAELQVLTAISIFLVVCVLLAVFRSLSMLVFLVLPLAIGILTAITAVQLVFGEIHGISLTFGITLIGVAIDYPVHLAAHASDGLSPRTAIKRIWPTLRLGVLTTMAGFMPIAFSGFPGLSQMGLFAIVGLVAAVAATKWLLPLFLPPVSMSTGWVFSGRVIKVVERLAVLRLAVLGVVILSAAIVAWKSNALFDDDLSRLSPVSDADKAVDRKLRRATGAPDVRYMVVIEGSSPELVLRRSEDLAPDLDAMVRDGVLSGFEMAARYLPSLRTQETRQKELPGPVVLRRALEEARAGLPFRQNTFAPFIRDVEAARTGAPVTYADFQSTGFGWLIEPLLSRHGDRWIGLVAPIGLTDVERLKSLVAADDDRAMRVLDLKSEADQLVRSYRQEALVLLGWGALALIAVLMTGLRSLQALLRVVVPVALSVLATIVLLVATGGALSLFNMLSLLLVAGIGLDYALFFNRYSAVMEDRAKTLQAIIICSGTTICVFAALAMSEMPVLRGIGLTVTVGAFLSLLFTLVFVTRKGGAEA